jgi:hypothetical protein
MNRDGASKIEGYSAMSCIEVRNDQLPKIVSSGMIFMQANAALSRIWSRKTHSQYLNGHHIRPL